MKVHIDSCIDDEIKTFLDKENNKSELINRLLREHYNQNASENLQLLIKKQGELKQIIKETRRKLKEIDKKVLKIKDKEGRILDLFKGLSKEQRDFIEQHRTEPSLTVKFLALKSTFNGWTFEKLNKFWRR